MSGVVEEVVGADEGCQLRQIAIAQQRNVDQPVVPEVDCLQRQRRRQVFEAARQMVVR